MKPARICNQARGLRFRPQCIDEPLNLAYQCLRLILTLVWLLCAPFSSALLWRSPLVPPTGTTRSLRRPP